MAFLDFRIDRLQIGGRKQRDAEQDVHAREISEFEMLGPGRRDRRARYWLPVQSVSGVASNVRLQFASMLAVIRSVNF